MGGPGVELGRPALIVATLAPATIAADRWRLVAIRDLMFGNRRAAVRLD